MPYENVWNLKLSNELLEILKMPLVARKVGVKHGDCPCLVPVDLGDMITCIFCGLMG